MRKKSPKVPTVFRSFPEILFIFNGGTWPDPKNIGVDRHHSLPENLAQPLIGDPRGVIWATYRSGSDHRTTKNVVPHNGESIAKAILGCCPKEWVVEVIFLVSLHPTRRVVIRPAPATAGWTAELQRLVQAAATKSAPA